MKFTKNLRRAGLVAAGTLIGQAALADVPADVPDSLSGTYELTYDFAQSGSPFTNGYPATFVINGANETLCVNGSLLADAYKRSASDVEILWEETTASGTLTYGLSTKTDGSFNEINVSTVADGKSTWVGQFNGQRVSTDTDCSGAFGLSTDALTALDMAEEIFDDLFPAGGASEFFLIKGYVARYYQDTGVYIGFKDGHIYVVGGPFGDKIIDQGDEAAVLIKLEKAKLKIEAPQGCNEDVTGQLGCGEWDITITGTVTQTMPVVGQITVNIPETVLEDVPMDNPASEDEIKQILTEYYEEYGTITNLKVEVVTNTSNHVVLDIAFDSSITQQGVTVNGSYDLHYDMTKN